MSFEHKSHSASITISGTGPDAGLDKQITNRLEFEERILKAIMLWDGMGVEPEPKMKAEIERRRASQRRAEIAEAAMLYWWDKMTDEQRKARVRIFESLTHPPPRSAAEDRKGESDG